MRVLLYGGTFDPPHNGHLHNLASAAACAKPDVAVVMPAGVPPHKAASRTPAGLRLEMCRCFAALGGTAEIPRVEISDWEIRRAAAGEPDYTVDTLAMLTEKYPGAALYLAVGSDMLLSFDTWRRWRDILRMAVLVVTSREADDLAALRGKAEQLDGAGRRILFAPAPALPLASHELRARMARGESCEADIPASVRAVIAREGLYRTCE